MKTFKALRRCLCLFMAIVFAAALFPTVASADSAPENGSTFANPILYNATNPFITYYDGYYYAVHTRPGGTNYISVRKAKRLAELQEAEEIRVYEVPEGQSVVWAPEIHRIDDKWYIYYCPETDHKRQIYVLESDTDDAQGTYTSKGEISLPTEDNIDPSVFRDEKTGELYFLWTWHLMPDGYNSNRNYIAHMSNPWTIDSDPMLLTEAEYGWEKHGRPITEAPVVLQKNDKTFVFYSGSGAGQDYAVGVVYNEDGDFLNPDSWIKMPEPILSKTDTILGPGHNGIFQSPDGTEDWIVYHAREPLWDTHKWCWAAQKLEWDGNGMPKAITPALWGTLMDAPSGELPETIDPNTIIIDNGGDGFTTNSTWTESTTVPGYYGKNYLHDGAITTSNKWAQWMPEISAAGDYDIYMRWVDSIIPEERPAAAPLEIKYDGGVDTTKTVNQRADSATWMLIGTYPLSAGTDSYVKISASDAGFTIADAVKFVRHDTEPQNTAPSAEDVMITGTGKAGTLLTGVYHFVDADGDEEGDSTYRWLIADDEDGDYEAIPDATDRTFVPTEEMTEKFIRFEVTPADEHGLAGEAVMSDAAVKIESAAPGGGEDPDPNTAPEAEGVAITGTGKAGTLLTGEYHFVDADGDEEGHSTYRWLIADDEDGDYEAIRDATDRIFVPTEEMAEKFIRFEVTPADEHGLTGEAVMSDAAVKIESAAPGGGDDDEHDSGSTDDSGRGSSGGSRHTVVASGQPAAGRPVVSAQNDPQGRPVVTVSASPLPNAKLLTAAEIAQKAADGTLNDTVNPNGVWDGRTTGANNVALVIDTREATLAPGGSCQLGVSAFAGPADYTLRVRASRGGFVTIVANQDGTYTITADRPVADLYILVEILDANGSVVGHSSMKLNAAAGLAPNRVENRAATIA